MATLPDPLCLPEGARLLHIGPHKTGTTALQGALALARRPMAAHGVVYPGEGRQHHGAALAVTGGKGLSGDPPYSLSHWQDLVAQVGAAGGGRVVVSSEFFDDADLDTARRVVGELGGEQVHVLVTLRPLTRILPSAWQQYVRNRLRTPYDEWLDAMLRRPPYVQPTTTFWTRHSHGALVQRWASVVGPDRLTVVVLDEADRSMLMRTVEALVGLPAGLLQPEQGRVNRSLTLGETELVRLLNVEFKRRGLPDALYRTFVREGLVLHLQGERTPEPDEAQITTPAWALERAAEIGAAAAAEIGATGVRVVGDLASLGAPAPPGAARRGDAPPEPSLPPDAALAAVMGTIVASGALGAPSAAINHTSSAELAGIVLRRAAGRARRLQRLRHRRR